MKIRMDKEGRNKIEGLCDVVLKALGMKALHEINLILESVEDIEKKEKPDGE